MLVPLIFAIGALLPSTGKTPAEPAPRHETPTGIGNYGTEFIDSIHGEGLIKLNGTSVTDLRVDGSLVSKGAQVGSMTVHGEANFRDTLINGSALVIGSIQAHGSTFNQPLTLCTPKATFTHTRIASLSIRKESGFKGKQVIELKQGTTVSGPIHFESGKGEVHIDPTSKVTGPVTGGKIIHKGA